jgi:hypothetical protein
MPGSQPVHGPNSRQIDVRTPDEQQAHDESCPKIIASLDPPPAPTSPTRGGAQARQEAESKQKQAFEEACLLY